MHMLYMLYTYIYIYIHYIALHYITSHYITLHDMTLHYIHLAHKLSIKMYIYIYTSLLIFARKLHVYYPLGFGNLGREKFDAKYGASLWKEDFDRRHWSSGFGV